MAVRQDSFVTPAYIPDDWQPTPENINALPEPLRSFVHDLQTICDPAGMVQEIAALKLNVTGLTKDNRELVRQRDHARTWGW